METNKHTKLHYREGKSQPERLLRELNPGSLKLNDFNVADWLLFAFNFAKHINFFDKGNNTTAAGDWKDFFDINGPEGTGNRYDLKIAETLTKLGTDGKLPRRETQAYKDLEKKIVTTLGEYEKRGNLTPHVGLFVCFIKLLEFTQKDFNNLTKRHLDFYYQDILKIQKRKAVSDKAHIIFELAKKAVQEKIPAGTVLDAGKDANGKKLTYKTNEDLIANQGKVVALKSLLNDAKKEELKVAKVANSQDGKGAALPETGNFWWPFGYNSSEKKYTELENAELGFSIASSLFEMKEGKRTVSVKIDYANPGKLIANDANGNAVVLSTDYFQQNIKVQCSGEKEWISDIVLKNAVNAEESLTLNFELAKEQPAVVAYNSAVLGESFNTKFPVVRFLIKGISQYKLYQLLSEKTISNVKVDVAVSGVKSVTLENDNGVLNAEKPYFPFSAQPIKGSNFIVKYPELFSKNWTSMSVKMDWKNIPSSLTAHYKGYLFDEKAHLNKNDFDKAVKEKAPVIKSDGHFTANTYLLNKEEWELKASNQAIFTKEGEGYVSRFTMANTSSTPGSSEAVRLTLNQSALQEVYPKLYTLALMSTTTGALIPNEPYIPLAEHIELSYTATETAFSLFRREGAKRLQLFHEDAFGQYEVVRSKNSIVTSHEAGGEFYIGLKATPGHTMSLLVQALEGSENPVSPSFEEGEKVTWEYLSGDVWMNMKNEIISDSTANFLQSGIIKFKIPKDINTVNYRLPKDIIWVRARMDKNYDAVCRLKGVFTQAIVATLQDNDNELSHLQGGLPAERINKLITRIPQIKSVSQKFNSFGGAYPEQDMVFYRRVSERLRHKNRAITQWDYEHLILQEFPEVFKVKCLPHTSKDSFIAPGHTTLIVVPNTRDKNAFDIYQPRVSRATLNKIQKFVNSLNTMHVEAGVMNPDYQEIAINVAVKFHDQFDEEFYKKQLDLDIKKYISPWAFDARKELVFDVNINVNLLIDFMERLEYVDYIDGISMYKDGVQQSSALTLADPKSILVSAKQHNITIANHNCPDKK